MLTFSHPGLVVRPVISIMAGAFLLSYFPAFASTRTPSTRDDRPFVVHPGDLPNKGVLFVDNERNGRRSGHGNQALVECKNGDILAFFSNTSGLVMNGHSNSGWTEYRISRDGGSTWTERQVLEYSLDIWYGKEIHAALVEEAVTASNGTVIAFIGRYTTHNWHRTSPVYLLSHDHGMTWSPPREIENDAEPSKVGRAHAAFVHEGSVFVLFDTGVHSSLKDGTGHKLYVSDDHGETFNYRSSLPFPEHAWYGTMAMIGSGTIIAYAYRTEDEVNMQYTTSSDQGRTWSKVETTLFAKGLRNPQMSEHFDGSYFIHGRSGHSGPDSRHLVLYSSQDGIKWDEGIYLNKGSTGDLDSYSTNEVVGKYSPLSERKLIIQSSISYDDRARVNLHHWTVRSRKGR